ncbi:MAG: hypothetical protein ABIT76_08630 [Chthoniobacterales bacterium]
MFDLSLNLDTQVARAASGAVFKAGAPVLVRIALNRAPSAPPVFELAISGQTTPPSTLCYYAGALDEESETVFFAVWDTNDTRLMEFIASKTNVALDLELAYTLEGTRFVSPNTQITCQQRIVNGPESSEGGPLYLTEAESDARYARFDGSTTTLLIGPKARLVAIANGFKFQVSDDGTTWQDGPSYVAS